MARWLRGAPVALLLPETPLRTRAGRGIWVCCILAFTRYSFSVRLLCTNQSSLCCLPPHAFPTLIAMLLHGYCAVNDPPPPPPPPPFFQRSTTKIVIYKIVV